MKLRILIALCVALALVGAPDANAFEADQVRIVRIESFDANGNAFVALSGNNTCPTPHAYFIIQRWDNQNEPLHTRRKLMYQLALTAFAGGNNIRVTGATCYLDRYLFAEQLHIYE